MADKYGRNMVVEQEFGPEMVGQRVGWVAITDHQVEKYVGLHIVASTVKVGGAKVQYEAREEEGRVVAHRGWDDSVAGFSDTLGLTMIVDTDQGPSEQVDQEVRWTVGDNTSLAINQAADGHNDKEELAAKRIWLPEASDVMPKMKELLEERGIGRYYPLAYYSANLAIAHMGQREFSRDFIKESDATKLLMPDADMVETTQEQISVTEGITAAYSNQIAEDKQMRQCLSVFGDIVADDLPRLFTESRRRVAHDEAAVQTHGQSILSYLGIRMPIGVRFGAGRSWPYMDASETDENRAFGHELEALRNRNDELVSRELSKELAELDMRSKHATQGLRVLQELAKLEANA